MKMQPPVKRDFLQTRPTVTNSVESSSPVVVTGFPAVENKISEMPAKEPELTAEQKQVIVTAEKDFEVLRHDRKLKNPGGRPDVVTSVVVLKLVSAFQSGMDIQTACQYSGISRATFYKHMKENVEFSDIIKDAKDYLKLTSGDRLKTIIEKGDERVAGPLAWKYLEKSIPKFYGNIAIAQQNNQQNNYYVIDTKQLSDIRQQPDIHKASPAELFETLKERSRVESGSEEGGAASVHQDEFQDFDTEVSSVPQSPSTI